MIFYFFFNKFHFLVNGQDTFSIILSVGAIVLVLGVILAFLVFFGFKKLKKDLANKKSTQSAEEDSFLYSELRSFRDELIKIQENTKSAFTDINEIRTMSAEASNTQRTNQENLGNLIKEFGNLKVENAKSHAETKELNENVHSITKIFSNSSERGELGEFSLYFIIERIFGPDSDIVQKQYTMKNKKRVDLFLQTNELGIPIDSKFPLDNFSGLFKINKKSYEYKDKTNQLKKNTMQCIKDVAEKYISSLDKTNQVLLYIPSQPLYDFINYDADFKTVLNYALDKKVVLTSPMSLPPILRLIRLYHENSKLQKNATKIIELICQMKDNFYRFSERWNKLNNRVNGLCKDANEFEVTVKKIKKQFDKSADTTLLQTSNISQPSPKKIDNLKIKSSENISE